MTPIDVPGTLTALGCTVLGEVPDAGGITPLDALRLVASGTVRPTERVTDDDAGLERAWRAQARRTGVLAEDGTCLLMISGPGTAALPWFRVRLPAGPFLARLRESTGTVEFLAVAPDGSPVLGLSEEEWDDWVVVVDPARAAAARAVDEFAEHLIALGIATEETVVGCTSTEVDEMRTAQGLDVLPVQYEEFLLRMGKRMGEFLRGTDVHHPKLAEVADEFPEMLDELGIVLAPGSAIIAQHGGYQLYWTEPDGTTRFGEENRDNPTHTWPSLVDCLRWEVGRLLDVRGERP